MNTPTIALLCLLSFGAGAKVSNYYYLQSLEGLQDYVELQRLKVIEQNVKQANGLLKSHQRDIASGRARFRASMFGVSLEM